MQKSISYIIAGYNEQDILNDSLNLVYNTLSADFEDFELLLVNDCSKDKTGEIMDNFAIGKNNVRVVHNAINLNFGASILIGLALAKKELATFNAADLGINPSLTKQIVENIGDTDLLVLERTNYASTSWRKVTSSINVLLLRILFPIAIKGTPVLNFTQIYKTEIIKSIMPLARSPIFVWPELIFRAKYRGFKVENMKVPMNVKEGEIREGAFGKPYDIIWGITDMLRFRIRKWMNKI